MFCIATITTYTLNVVLKQYNFECNHNIIWRNSFSYNATRNYRII